MEIIVKREDIPGGIKLTTKDCEYPRHFASTIRQALLLDGLNENTVEAIFGKTPNMVCASKEERHHTVENSEQLTLKSMMDEAKSLGVIPIFKPAEFKPDLSEELEDCRSLLTVDCGVLSAHTRQPWYKNMVKHLENPAIISKFKVVYGAERTALYNKERGLVIEPAAHNVYGVAPLEVCNSIDSMEGDSRFTLFESLADALNFAM